MRVFFSFFFFKLLQNTITLELTGERYNLSRDNGVLIIKKVIKDDAGTYKCVARSTDKSDEKDAALTVLGRNFA